MKNMLYRSIIVVCVAVAGVTVSSRAWSQAVTGGVALEFPLSTRSEGMASGGVADLRDPGNIFRNPAAVTAVNGIYALGSYKRLVPYLANDVWFGDVCAGVGRTLDNEQHLRVAFGVTLARVDYGESIRTDAGGMPLGTATSHEGYVALTGGSSATFGRYLFAVGAAYKRYSTDFGPPQFSMPPGYDRAADANAFDLGMVVSTDVPADAWTVVPALAIAAVNVGSELKYDDGSSDPLPGWFNYGVSARVLGPSVALGSRDVPVMSTTINVDGSHGLNEQRPNWSFGSEIALLDVVYMRWGREVDDRNHDLVTSWGAGLGVPAGPICVTLDYANRTWNVNTDQFGMTVVWNFAGPSAP